MAQQEWSAPPAMQIDVAKNYSVSIETNRGTIELELYPQHAPQTVNNFVFLAGQGFYDGVKFHRVIDDFMIQTGDPTGTGRGGPGLQVRRRVQGQSAEARAQRHLDGQRRSEHQWQPVLHHALAAVALERQAHGVRQGDEGRGRRRRHSPGRRDGERQSRELSWRYIGGLTPFVSAMIATAIAPPSAGTASAITVAPGTSSARVPIVSATISVRRVTSTSTVPPA